MAAPPSLTLDAESEKEALQTAALGDEQEESQQGLLALPSEVLVLVLSWLDAKQVLIDAALSCSHLQSLTHDETLWKLLCRHKFLHPLHGSSVDQV